MAGNSFGELFKITTFGESHGPAVGVVIDGVPPNIPLKEADIQFDLDRRKPGQSDITTPRKESDTVEILSGIFNGKTTGTPLTLVVRNADARSGDYESIKNAFRPGHADFTFLEKYGIRDYRGGGRSSGRETIGRVAAGAVAKKILREYGITVVAYTQAIGDITAENADYAIIERNAVRAADMKAAEKMLARIKEVKEKGDSIGGVIEAVVHGCPAGLGDPVFDKFTARLGHAILSIGAIRGIEFGDGFKAATMLGSQHNDKMYVDGTRIRTRTNHAGGIIGGISNGANIILRAAVKPTSSISQPQQTATIDAHDTTIEITGRHDPCLCPRIVPVIEAMIALVITDCLLLQKALGPTNEEGTTPHAAQ